MNINLNGAVLGYSRSVLDKKFDEILDFSELENFIDVPLKNYSSGMVTRLGFSIATIVTPDVLIVDEILSVGDFLFQEKCEKMIKDMLGSGTTVLFVSHSIEQVKKLCGKALWLKQGELITTGNIDEVCSAYTEPT